MLMKKLNCILILVIVAFSFNVAAQKKSRIQPGRMYEAGDTLYAPRFGFTATVPTGWQGMLPRENEVFLLTSTSTSVYGEIYVFGRPEGDLPVMAETWMKGFDLSETIRLKAKKPTLKDGVLSAEVVAVGEYINKGNKGFAISRCNPNGPCVTMLMVAPIQFYESVKSTVTQMMTSSTFQPPSSLSPYADFDWKEFLSGKVLANYTSIKGGTKESIIHLCTDGTFQSDTKKSGILKNHNPEYRGWLSGKWIVTGTGEEARIQLNFDKKGLAPIEAQLQIKDEKVYSNGGRYFVGDSDKCK
jgi:hypothetical protein